VQIAQVTRPDPDAHAAYGEYYRLYRALYTRTAPLMGALGALAHGPSGQAAG